MSDARAIVQRCRGLGLRLWADNGQIAIKPARLTSPGLLEEIRRCKPQVLDLLEAEAANLAPDCIPWLHVARQIMTGEFDAGDHSLLVSLLIGLRSIPHPTCISAKARLEALLAKRKGASK